MKSKIGVFGSADGDMAVALPIAKKVGEVLGEHADEVIVITGACSGLPYAAAEAASQASAETWGFSCALDLAGYEAEYPDHDAKIYTKLQFVEPSFAFADNDRMRKKYRNVLATASCDAGIIISGRWGTLNEFTNLIDFQKVVGVLIGTGGIADELEALSQKISKEGQGKLIFDSDPKSLVEKLLAEVNNQK